MALFSKLLLAIDLSHESELLISRVAPLCRQDADQLHVVHVIKHGMHDMAMRGENLQLSSHARRMHDHITIKIRDLMTLYELEIPADQIYLAYGEPSYEIKRIAADIDADLVIVGSHTKENDWLQLPGATTNCVIQGISSDVMAVKI